MLHSFTNFLILENFIKLLGVTPPESGIYIVSHSFFNSEYLRNVFFSQKMLTKLFEKYAVFYENVTKYLVS
jgi:hypothetical protein